jgi:hypothetical protein
VDRDQQVGDELHLHAVAEAAQIMCLAREIGEQRHQAVDRLRVAARIDHEILGARLRAGTAQWAIEHHVAGRAQLSLGHRLVVEREGGELRDHAARQFCRDDRVHRFGQRLGLGQAEQDVRCPGGERRGAARDLDARGFCLGAARRIDIVADHLPTGGAQIPGDRPAHDAEADDADLPLGNRCVHDVSSSLA